jgi:hypothetical protein
MSPHVGCPRSHLSVLSVDATRLWVSWFRTQHHQGFTYCGKSHFEGGPFKLCLSGVHLQGGNVPHSSQKRLEWATQLQYDKNSSGSECAVMVLFSCSHAGSLTGSLATAYQPANRGSGKPLTPASIANSPPAKGASMRCCSVNPMEADVT